MKVWERIESLRKRMREEDIDVYYIPTNDFHGSEYVSGYFQTREYISGFTGSAGVVIVTLEDAGLWTDGRYFIQAEKQLQDPGRPDPGLQKGLVDAELLNIRRVFLQNPHHGG